jgi:UDP-glucose 4-epimerase
MAAAICGEGAPGAYNLAAEGEVSMSAIARALGWRAVPVPRPAVNAGAAAAKRLAFATTRLEWAAALDTPVLMDTAKARRELRWKPHYDADETLLLTVDGARRKGLLD